MVGRVIGNYSSPPSKAGAISAVLVREVIALQNDRSMVNT